MTSHKKFKIVADENIPYIREHFEKIAEISSLPGRKISHQDLLDADILMVRSVTKVTAELLKNTPVKFVGSATTGTDHVDLEWLEKNQITFVDAKGTNSNAVAEYILCCIAYLIQEKVIPRISTVGIIGVGRIGSLIANKLKILNIKTLLNDPPRAKNEIHFVSTPFEAMQNADLLTIHTPLFFKTDYPTYHLINDAVLNSLKERCVVFNTSRGEIIDSKSYLKFAKKIIGCFDVWENEPYIHSNVLSLTTIATPHVAGYTVEAKLQGALVLCKSLQKYLNLPQTSMVTLPTYELDLHNTQSTWQQVLLKVYNPAKDTKELKQILNFATENEVAAHFDQLRKNYPKRHEFNSIILKNTDAIEDSDIKILQKLGFNI